MANLGNLESLLGPLEDTIRRVLLQVLRALVPNQRFGPVEHQTKSENFQAYYLTSTTAASTGTEFSILHGMGRIPYLAIPILPLDSTGLEIVRLRATRVADAQRVYLQAPDTTSALVALLVE